MYLEGLLKEFILEWFLQYDFADGTWQGLGCGHWNLSLKPQLSLSMLAGFYSW